MVLDQLEEEAAAIFIHAATPASTIHPALRGAPLPTFSCSLFADILDRWLAWKKGIPPTAGGHAQQNPRLLQAFARLDSAEARATTRARATAQQPKEDPRSFHDRIAAQMRQP